MDVSDTLEPIRIDRSAVRVVRVRGNERNPSRKTDDHGRMVKIAVGSAELNDIADFDFIDGNESLPEWFR